MDYIVLPPMNDASDNHLMKNDVIKYLTEKPIFKNLPKIKLNIYIKTNKTGECKVLFNKEMLHSVKQKKTDDIDLSIKRISLPIPLYPSFTKPVQKNKIWSYYEKTIKEKLDKLFYQNRILLLPDPEYPDDPDSDKVFIIDRQPSYKWHHFPLSEKYSKYKFYIYPIFKNYQVLELNTRVMWPPPGISFINSRTLLQTQRTGRPELHINILVTLFGDWKKDKNGNIMNKVPQDISGEQKINCSMKDKASGFCNGYVKNLKDTFNDYTGNNNEKEFKQKVEKRDNESKINRGPGKISTSRMQRIRDRNMHKRGKWICGGKKTRKKGRKKKHKKTRKYY